MKRKAGEPQKISSAIGTISKNFGFKDMLDRAVIWRKWTDLVGKQVAEMAWPKTFRDRNILVVAVADSVWMHQLSYLKPVILKGMNRHLNGNAKLTDIRFVLDDIKKVKEMSPIYSEKKQGAANSIKNLPDDQIERAKSLTQNIKDPKLKKAMYNLYLKNAAHHMINDQDG